MPFDLEQTVNRLKNHHGLANDKDLASLVGLSPSGFTNRKKTGGLIRKKPQVQIL